MLIADGGPGEDGLSPEEAFAILGNEHRAEILRTLGDEQGTEGPRPTLSFSELYSRADVDAATSQFNYHLQQLVGPFVEKTVDGYRLRHEGVTLYRTILAGTYTARASIDEFEVGVDCYHCDAPVVAAYDDRRFAIRCSECGREYSDTTVPPSVVQGDREALLHRLDQYARQRILAFSNGVCSVCANAVRTRILRAGDLAVSGADQLDVFVHRACDHCGAQQYMSVGLALLYDSSLISFFEQHGVDVTKTPIWELEFAMTDRFLDVRSTAPWELALRVECSGDEFELVVDGSLNAVS